MIKDDKEGEKEGIDNIRSWKRQKPMHSFFFFFSSWPYKNGPWAQSISLPRDGLLTAYTWLVTL